MRKLELIINDDGSATIQEDGKTVRDDIPPYEVEAFIQGL